MQENALQFDNVSVRFGDVNALEDITLSIAEHEIVSIVGPNGSGKSTFLRTALGLIKPTHGEVRLFGRESSWIYRSGMVGYLPQMSGYDNNFPIKVYDVVALALRARKGLFERLNNKDKEAINFALKRVNMLDFASRCFSTLSGGQKQKVLIARALSTRPRLLVLDEPSTGLDASAQESFYTLMKSLRDSEGVTILMVSHDLGAVSMVVDKLMFLRGKLHYYGKPGHDVPAQVIEDVFGRNVRILVHNQNCIGCGGCTHDS